MSEVHEDKITLRQKIIARMIELLEAIEHPETGALFANVLRGDLSDYDISNGAAAGVDEGDEETIDQMHPALMKQLRVYVHFKCIPLQDGVDPYDLFNYYLGELQSKIVGQDKYPNLVIDCQEAGSRPNVATDDPEPGGVLILDVKYRHKNGDPYTRI